MPWKNVLSFSLDVRDCLTPPRYSNVFYRLKFCGPKMLSRDMMYAGNYHMLSLCSEARSLLLVNLFSPS